MNKSGTQTLQTNRLILRQFQIQDASQMYDNWAKDEQVTKYLTWPAHSSIETTQKVLKMWIHQYKNLNYYQWAIELKETHEIIGSIGVTNEMDERLQCAHIGYCIGTKWWHQGYTSEALQEVIHFLFEEVDVVRIESKHNKENIHSGQVMKKCGMKYEGCLRQSDIDNQGFYDACFYGMIKGDYKTCV